MKTLALGSVKTGGRCGLVAWAWLGLILPSFGQIGVDKSKSAVFGPSASKNNILKSNTPVAVYGNVPFQYSASNPVLRGAFSSGMSSNVFPARAYGPSMGAFNPPIYNTPEVLPEEQLNSGQFLPAGEFMPSIQTQVISPGISTGSWRANAVRTRAARRQFDGALVQDVRRVLARSSSISSAGVRVSSEGSTIVLEGTISDDAERRAAENLVRLIPGVYAVQNDLRVGESKQP
jgi:hypothetical protein